MAFGIIGRLNASSIRSLANYQAEFSLNSLETLKQLKENFQSPTITPKPPSGHVSLALPSSLEIDELRICPIYGKECWERLRAGG